MLTRKDYKALSHLINVDTDDGSIDVIVKSMFLFDLCVLLKEDNPNFDKQKFMDACYQKEDKR